MGGRGSSSSSSAALAAKRSALLEYAESLTSKSYVSAKDRDRAELATTAAGLVGTDTLKALSESNLTEGVKGTFRRNGAALNMGVSNRLSSLSGKDRAFVEERISQIGRETGATRQQIDAYFAFSNVL